MLNQIASTWNYLWTVLVPVWGVVLAAALLLYGGYVRFVDLPQKWLLTRRTLLGLIAMAVLCNAWLGLHLYLTANTKQTQQDAAALRASRERFVLPRDFQYGELVIPAGSLVNRNDPFFRGAANSPLEMHGLDAVQFAQPVQVAGVWATALQTLPARVELAQNQRIGPVYRYDTATQTWVQNKVISSLLCKKGKWQCFRCRTLRTTCRPRSARPRPTAPPPVLRPASGFSKPARTPPPTPRPLQCNCRVA